jgi:hypothetical protein
LSQPEIEELLRVVRPMLKGHLRQTRYLLEMLTALDRRLEANTQSQEAERNGKHEEHARQ